MKSLFISTFLLVILITSWIIGYNFISESIDDFNSLLSKIETNIYNENWNIVISNYNKLYKEWRNTKKVLMLILDHEEMEKVNLTLEKLDKYISIKERSLSLGETAALKYLLNHVREKESLSLDNIF